MVEFASKLRGINVTLCVEPLRECSSSLSHRCVLFIARLCEHFSFFCASCRLVRIHHHVLRPEWEVLYKCVHLESLVKFKVCAAVQDKLLLGVALAMLFLC